MKGGDGGVGPHGAGRKHPRRHSGNPPPAVLTRVLAATLPHDRRGRSILGDLVEDWHGRAPGPRRLLWYLFEVIGLSARYLLVRRRLPGIGVSSLRPQVGSTSRAATATRMMLDTLRSDLRHAMRVFRRSPVFTFAAVGALALGIGANTAIFSVVDSVLLKPLPFPDASRLVLLGLKWPQGRQISESPALFEFRRGETSTLRDVAAFRTGPMAYSDGQGPEQMPSAQVSAAFFRLFGLRTILGRTFTPQEDMPGAGNFVVISRGMWRTRFHADPSIVGRSISLGGDPYTVLGVLDTFSFEDFGPTPDVIVPFQLDPSSDAQGNYFYVGARLGAGTTLARARAAAAARTPAFRTRFPNILPAEDRFTVVSMRDGLVPGSARTSLYLLLGAVAFVLLIACANVANLILAHTAGRRREIAVRTALGGSRGRIVRQLLTESVLLAVAGGGFGYVVGTVGIRTLLAVNTAGLPRISAHGAHVTMEWRVFAFTLGVSLLTAIAFGLVPSLGAARPDLAAAFHEGSARTGSGRRLRKAHGTFVITEFALAVVLLVGSGLLIRTLVALGDVDPGFDAHNVLVLNSTLIGPRLSSTAHTTGAVRDATERVEAIAGVQKAAATYFVPLEWVWGFGFTIAGRPATDGAERPVAYWKTVSPGYFSVFRIKLLRGRAFNESDDAHAPPVVIISETLAKKYWPEGGALGARLTLGHGVMKQFDAEPERRIVGIVADTREAGLNDQPFPQLYEPLAQCPAGLDAFVSSVRALSWVVRTRTPPSGLRRQVEAAIRQSTGSPVTNVFSMSQVVGKSTSRQRFNTWLMTAFGVCALVLAAIGIHGVMAYAVEQRTPEIGIRRALGADRGDVKSMVVRQGMRLVALGAAVGVAAAMALSRLIASFLYGVQAWDPLVFVSVPAVLAAVAFLAVWWPARRASRVDPLVAMRSE